MGEVVKNIRTFALPNEQNTYTFAMSFEYDSWNRILSTFYPDGEHVRYWKGYTKHYYAGSERVIGVLFDAHEFRLDKLYFYKNAESGKMDRYFYHPDHLGSSSWITDNTGRPIQHLHYLPFGEDWVDQRNSNWNAPYTFSGKEKDVETGYGYFGARYYDSGLSIWLSVDPMSDKYPNMSPYNYCANNPIILVDPDGRLCTFADGETEKFVNKLIDPNSKFYNKAFHDEYKKLESQEDFTYEFQGWASEPAGDQGEFREVSDKKAIIGFTMGETSDTRNELSGQGTKFRLFEETFHATQYESNNRKIENSCITEAEAWQFAAINAPGNKYSYIDQEGFNTRTLVGDIKRMTIPEIANMFKNGKVNPQGVTTTAIYPDFPLGTSEQLTKYNMK